MKKQKFEKWQRQIAVVGYQMRDIQNFCCDARVFWWATQQHDDFFESGKVFGGFVLRGQQAFLAMAVRRLLKSQDNSTSLGGLLDNFIKLYSLAKECFSRLPDAAEITADRDTLVAGCKPVMDFVDKMVAHHDPRQSLTEWESGLRLNPTINLAIWTASKYVDLCTEPYTIAFEPTLEMRRSVYGRKWLREGNEIPAELFEWKFGTGPMKSDT